MDSGWVWYFIWDWDPEIWINRWNQVQVGFSDGGFEFVSIGLIDKKEVKYYG